MLLDKNGNGRKVVATKEKKPEDYIYEANAKAQGRTAFVGAMGERLFLEAWKSLYLQAGLSEAVVSEAMDECLAYADMWRKKLNAYQNAQAEEVHNAEVSKAAASNLILPTWGEVKDHFPGAAHMFGGGN
jgi:hypothetical protein